MQMICRDNSLSSWLGADPFAAIRNVEGEVVRSKEGRTTTRFELHGAGYYVKLHEGIGWGEVTKNLFQLRLPVIGASNEWHAIAHLERLGIDTLDGVAFGQRGYNPAYTESFVITRELTNTVKLSELCETWPETPPAPRLRRALIDAVARLASTMHGSGMNHRDLYLCHFLLDAPVGREGLSAHSLKLILVDLHRAQLRSKVPRRWLVKDLASIYFSAMNIGLTRRDVYRFIRAYTGLPLRQSLTAQAGLWSAVRRRARQLYRRDFGRNPIEALDG